MDSDPWTSLARPFPKHALEWRVLRLDDEQLRAQARPQLRADAVLRRLDEVVGVASWSNALVSLGPDAVACTLTVQAVSKSAAASLGPASSATTLADDALVYAAERFHMLPPADLALTYWVDYDRENRTMLYEPSPVSSDEMSVEVPAPAAVTPSVSSALSEPAAPAPKSAGQQAIDRLVERLKAEGRSLEVAKLIIAYDGYGTDPDAARELYAKLRQLLREGQ